MLPALVIFFGAGALGVGALAVARLSAKSSSNDGQPLNPQPLPPAASMSRSLPVAIRTIPPPRPQLTTGHWYRVYLSVPIAKQDEIRARAPSTAPSPQAYLTGILSKGVEELGFSAPRLALKDPTDDATWTFIARWDAPNTLAPEAVLRAEDVPEPPDPSPEAPYVLDPGMTVDEVHAVSYALAHDDDPKHLGGFAATLTPDYPLAFSLLTAKEKLTAAEKQGPFVQGQLAQQTMRVQGAIGHRMLGIGWQSSGPPLVDCVARGNAFRRAQLAGGFEFSDITDPILDTAKDIPGVGDVTEELRKASKDLGDAVSSVWDKFGGAIETLGPILGTAITGPEIWMVETAYKVAKSIIDGTDATKVMSEQGAKFARGLQQMSPYVAMIPGLGTGIAVMMNAAAAIALAQPLDQAAINTLAASIPGGPVVQDAFKIATTAGYGLARGERLDRAALEGVRAGLPEEAQIAFDAGLALAQGKSLQDAGFKALYAWTKGNDLLDRAAHFSESVTHAAQQHVSITDFLIDEAKTDLANSVPDDLTKSEGINRVITSIVKDPSIAQGFPTDIVRKIGDDKILTPSDPVVAALRKARGGMGFHQTSSVAVVRAALQALRFLPVPHVHRGTIAIVNKPVLDKLISPKKAMGKAKPKPPAGALALVQATRRPEMSKVVAPGSVASKIAAITTAAKAGDLDGLKAKESLERANKILERRKWIDWYKRVEHGESSQAPSAPILSTPTITPHPSRSSFTAPLQAAAPAASSARLQKAASIIARNP